MNYLLCKAAMAGLYASGAGRLLRRQLGGVGTIVMLHRVRPARSDSFQPNLSLEITPEFLATVIGWLRRNGYAFVSLDELCERLAEGAFDSRFVTFTLDDGYKDNRLWAKPVFEKFGVPYTIYVPTSYAEGDGDLWWLTIEAIVAGNDAIDVGDAVIASRTLKEKRAAYGALRRRVMACPGRVAEIAFVRDLADRHGQDVSAAAREACMRWDELRAVADDPLATIGAHTVSHLCLAKADDEEVRRELVDGRRILEQQLGCEVRHLAYPYGARYAVGEREFRIAGEVGYASAVTTELGVLRPSDAGRMTALPRVNIDGRLQQENYADVLLSGLGPASWRLVSRLA